MGDNLIDLKKYALEHGFFEDIFTYTDLRYPSGMKILRSDEQVRRWMEYYSE